MTTSLCSARSSGVSKGFAPASASGFAFSALRFQTLTVWPVSINRAAIAAPMRPSPAIPICIDGLRRVLLRHAHEDASRGDIMSAATATGQETRTVGIIGLGIMGGAIAKNLAAAGWHVVGFDIEKTRCAEAKAAGVEIAGSVAAVAAQAMNILISLPKPEALMATVAAIVDAKQPRRVIAELSTFSLDDKMEAEGRLRAGGHTMLDCPLSGTGSQARTKDLVVYASGDPQAINAMMPVF